MQIGSAHTLWRAGTTLDAWAESDFANWLPGRTWRFNADTMGRMRDEIKLKALGKCLYPHSPIHTLTHTHPQGANKRQSYRKRLKWATAFEEAGKARRNPSTSPGYPEQWTIIYIPWINFTASNRTYHLLLLPNETWHKTQDTRHKVHGTKAARLCRSLRAPFGSIGRYYVLRIYSINTRLVCGHCNSPRCSCNV